MEFLHVSALEISNRVLIGFGGLAIITCLLTGAP
jgi:hypothetical protein